MMKLARPSLWTLGLATMLTVAHAGAFQSAPAPAPGKSAPAPQTHRSQVTKPGENAAAPAAATVERLMAQAVRNIAVRYNLNADQSAETQKIMTRRVHQFLRDHEDEVWPVIRDLIAGGFKPSTDKDRMVQTGKAALPLMKLVKEAILEGNEEWRYVLTPEQKKLHDYDLNDMQRQFDAINKNFQDWATGKYAEKSVFPEPRAAQSQPTRPHKPAKGLPAPELDIPADPNYVFDAIVEEFVQEYEVDDGQITAAQSILQEFRAKADDYRAAKKAEFAKSLADQQDARSARDIDAVKRTREEYKELLAPIHALCGKMETRLMAQLTTAQIQRHEARVRAGEGTRESEASLAARETSSQARKAAAKQSKPAKTDAKPARDNG